MAIIFLLSILEPSVIAADRLSNIKSDYYRKNFEDTQLPVARRILYADSLMAENPEDVPLSVYNLKSKMLLDEGRLTESLKILAEMQKKIPRDSLRLKYDVMIKTGMVRYNGSDYCGAVDMAYRVLHEPKPDSLQYFDLYAYWIIIDFYRTARQWPLAWKYQEAGLEKLKTLPVSSLFPAEEHDYVESVFHQSGASLYLATHQPDNAYDELDKSIKLSKNDNLTLNNYTTFAEIAYQKNEYGLAEHYYKEALRVSGKSPACHYNANHAVVGWVKMMLEKGEVKRADSLMHVYRKEMMTIKKSPLERMHLENMARYYHLLGDYDTEANTLRRVIELSDSLHQASLLIGSGTVPNRYEYEEVADTISDLKSGKRNITVWTIVIASFLIVVLILFYIYVRKFYKSRRNVSGLQKELLAIEGRHKEASLEAEESMKTQSQELSTMAMYLARLDDAFGSIRDNALSKNEEPEERLLAIRKIVDELQIQNNAWEMFRTYFNRVHQSFFEKLHFLHPNLTNAESRMCAFILMGLTTKEIAAFTNRSPRTVEAIKYNIRKKLGTSESTENYLRSLALRSL